MKTWILPVLVVLGLSACASYRISDTQRLALYEAHAGAPVERINYKTPIGWDRVDDQHVAIDLRPGERWLLTLSGPCLRMGSGASALQLSPLGGMVLSRFDRVEVSGSQVSCRIEEIRPVDLPALRAGEKALRDKR